MKKNSPPPPGTLPANAGRSSKQPVKQENPSQIDLFDSAMNLFHRRDFSAAMPLFAQAAEGGNREVAHAARQHLNMCRQRVAAQTPDLHSAEDHYQYGIGLIALRKLNEARSILAKAAELNPAAGHIQYSFGICLGLSGDLPAAARHISLAIQIDPKNRSIARTDPDFLEFGRYSPVREVVFPEKKERDTQLPS